MPPSPGAAVQVMQLPAAVGAADASSKGQNAAAAAAVYGAGNDSCGVRGDSGTSDLSMVASHIGYQYLDSVAR